MLQLSLLLLLCTSLNINAQKQQQYEFNKQQQKQKLHYTLKVKKGIPPSINKNTSSTLNTNHIYITAPSKVQSLSFLIVPSNLLENWEETTCENRCLECEASAKAKTLNECYQMCPLCFESYYTIERNSTRIKTSTFLSSEYEYIPVITDKKGVHVLQSSIKVIEVSTLNISY